MYVNMGAWQPIKCSKCGSLKAVKPLNELGVEIRCLDCGHEMKTPPPVQSSGATDFMRWPRDDKKQPEF